MVFKIDALVNRHALTLLINQRVDLINQIVLFPTLNSDGLMAIGGSLNFNNNRIFFETNYSLTTEKDEWNASYFFLDLKKINALARIQICTTTQKFSHAAIDPWHNLPMLLECWLDFFSCYKQIGREQLHSRILTVWENDIFNEQH